MMIKLAVRILALLFTCTDVSSLAGLLPSAPPPSTQSPCPNVITCEPCPTTATCASPPPPAPVPPVLGALTVRGEAGSCRGVVYLELNGSAGLPLCRDGPHGAQTRRLCEQLGCGAYQSRGGTRRSVEAAYRIHGNGSLETSVCRPLEIHCRARPDSRELVAYKVLTGLLSMLFLLVLLFRFAPRISSFIHKRVQASTWIGPTQSQSVSFYRAQAGVQPNSRTDKRLSYPGLERLAVNSSLNPSSNRNSDCDSYN